jgi:hypothetical protein
MLQNSKAKVFIVNFFGGGGFEKTLPGFDQYFPAKCSVSPLLLGAEHYQSLETAVTNV